MMLPCTALLSCGAPIMTRTLVGYSLQLLVTGNPSAQLAAAT